MGVLACDRYKCKNIMCDRHSYHYGYICNECFEELVNLGPETNIASFMDREQKRCQRDASFARFNVEFKER